MSGACGPRLQSSGTGIVAIRTVRDDGVLTTRYVTGNHLGGVSVISDEVGTVDQRMSYGAFGERRDPANWQPYSTMPDLTNITDKGYAGQQQLDAVGLIHMNGRVYDPEIGRFMSADPIVPDPLDSQSFARYAYVGNNPLSAIDPSGFDGSPPMVFSYQGASYTCPNCAYWEGYVNGPEQQIGQLGYINDNVIDQISTFPVLPPPTVPPIDTTVSVAPQPIPTGSGGNGSTGSGNNNPANFGSGNFLLPIDTPCQYGSNCGGNNGVQQAMNDTNGVQDVSWGDIDWGSMGGSGKLHAPPGPVEIPGPNGHYIGGPVAGPSRSPGSEGMTIGMATTHALPWAPELASGLESLALKALGVAGLVLSLSGDTPQEQKYFNHYTTAQGYLGIMRDKQIQLGSDLKIYMTPNVYVTGNQAQQALQLSNTPIGYFQVPMQDVLPIAAMSVVPNGTGTQVVVDHPVSIEGAKWIPIPP